MAYQRDACVDGAPWRKPLLIVMRCESVGYSIRSLCQGGHSHITLSGPAPEWGSLDASGCTLVAGMVQGSRGSVETHLVPGTSPPAERRGGSSPIPHCPTAGATLDWPEAALVIQQCGY